jgi:hypothetical protein
MGPHLAALLVIGALLTVALLGAVVLAAAGRGPGSPPLDAELRRGDPSVAGRREESEAKT